MVRLPSHTVFPGVQKIVGCAFSSSLSRLVPRRSEFPLTLRLRRSPFANGGWRRLTYDNKPTQAQQVLLAGSTMKDLPIEIGEYEWAIKHIILLFIFCKTSFRDQANCSHFAETSSSVVVFRFQNFIPS